MASGILVETFETAFGTQVLDSVNEFRETMETFVCLQPETVHRDQFGGLELVDELTFE